MPSHEVYFLMYELINKWIENFEFNYTCFIFAAENY